MAKVYYGMATYPPRKKCLKEVIPNILPQCTKLFVFLNGYQDVPKILVHPRINVIMGKDVGDCGDIGKFYYVDQIKEYYFTVDDDIIYPPDYSQKLVKAIDDHQRKAVLGVHGCVLNQKNMWNYYRSRSLTHYRGKLTQERCVHIIGTGTAAFHTSTIKISKDSFPKPNMADVWFGLEAQKQRVPFILIPRQMRWLNDAPSAPQTTSIYSKSKNKSHGKFQTRTIKEYGRWELFA